MLLLRVMQNQHIALPSMNLRSFYQIFDETQNLAAVRLFALQMRDVKCTNGRMA